MKNPQPIGAKVLSITIALGVTLCLFGIYMFLTSCSPAPLAAPAPRVLLDTSLEFLGEYRIPQGTKINNVPVGGLSGLTFDRQRNVFYAVSDDRSVLGPARFYTLQLALDPASRLQKVNILSVTTLRNEEGKTYPVGQIDAEAIALAPGDRVFISSEGDRKKSIPPMLAEFDLKTGNIQRQLRLPARYLPDAENLRGVQSNLAFESLALAPYGTGSEQLNLFAATESPLMQDKEPVKKDQPAAPSKNRWLHYLVSEQTTPLADYAYEVEPPPLGAIEHGLSEMQALDNSGHFLALERSLSLMGFKVSIFQAVTGGATDVSSFKSLVGSNVANITKKLVLNLDALKIKLDNIEGMAIGPRLPDGSQSLLLVSDDNFNPLEITQFLWFRLRVS
jgi:hypothetical protein